ncbi:ABC transporter permease [Egicoccus sp. AB-alg2]|uniref:ABC transporter permease n=1 Tax=Egicoccus sp. AB-alg2 TaxID=3242693 RepID=UPI00359D4AA2
MTANPKRLTGLDTSGKEVPLSLGIKKTNPVVAALTSVAGAVGLVVLWQLVVWVFDIPLYVVPGPADVAASLVNDFDLLLRNVWPTALESGAGFLIGNVVAILLAIVFVHNATLERSLFPVAVVIRTVPIVAIAPVLVLMLGNGYAPKIAIAALISFFPTLVNMVRGFHSADPQAIELFRVLSASQWEIFWKVRAYSSLPFLFSSLKIAATSSVIGAIVAEWIGANQGLGALIIDATFNFRTPLLYSTMVFASLLALGFFFLIGLIERRVVTWEVESSP